MSTLLFTITTIGLTTSTAPTTLFPIPSNNSIIPITGATGFQLCTKLHLAGCGTNTIPSFVRSYVNTELQSANYNYSLPLDPCDFDTINMTWILSLADLSLLSIITADQIINEMPCELYIQMPNDFLSDRGISHITTDSYWFGPTGHCIYNKSNVLDCSNPNRSTLNYTETQLGCFYPFVKSNYKTPFKQLYDAGFEHCGVSCDYIPYNGDITKLDGFNYASSIIALIFGVCFFINVSFEVRRAWNGKTKLRELPLTFDIPIMISVWMLVLTIIIGIASWKGKEYFACEIGTNALAEHVRIDNKRCYIAGQFTMISIMSVYFYCSLLAFSIYRSLANPFRPLFNIHKIWYHVALNIVVLGYYIGAMSEDVFNGNNITGLCGPDVTGEYGIKYLFIPLMFDIITFVIFTTLSIYKLWKHFQHQQKHSVAEKAIANLAIRMVIYSAFIAASLICFLYMSGRFVTDGNEWSVNVESNVNCLVERELFGGINECELELPVEDNVYWMQGLVILLVSIASFVLSCSNQRYTDYSKIKIRAKASAGSTIKKMKKISIGHLSQLSEMVSDSSKKSSRKDTGTPCTTDEYNTGSMVSDTPKNDSNIDMTDVEKIKESKVSNSVSTGDENNNENNERNDGTY